MSFAALLQLDDNHRAFLNNTCPIQVLVHSICGTVHGPLTPQMIAKVKSHFQSTAYNQLCQHHAYNPEARVRAKQERWNLHKPQYHPHVTLSIRQSTPAWQARRTLHNLHLLASLTTLRVCAAAFGTIWNRWTTARRFQQRYTTANRCVFRCPFTAR